MYKRFEGTKSEKLIGKKKRKRNEARSGDVGEWRQPYGRTRDSHGYMHGNGDLKIEYINFDFNRKFKASSETVKD
jgi:hypothetical protein